MDQFINAIRNKGQGALRGIQSAFSPAKAHAQNYPPPPPDGAYYDDVKGRWVTNAELAQQRQQANDPSYEYPISPDVGNQTVPQPTSPDDAYYDPRLKRWVTNAEVNQMNKNSGNGTTQSGTTTTAPPPAPSDESYQQQAGNTGIQYSLPNGMDPIRVVVKSPDPSYPGEMYDVSYKNAQNQSDEMNQEAAYIQSQGKNFLNDVGTSTGNRVMVRNFKPYIDPATKIGNLTSYAGDPNAAAKEAAWNKGYSQGDTHVGAGSPMENNYNPYFDAQSYNLNAKTAYNAGGDIWPIRNQISQDEQQFMKDWPKTFGEHPQIQMYGQTERTGPTILPLGSGEGKTYAPYRLYSNNPAYKTGKEHYWQNNPPGYPKANAFPGGGEFPALIRANPNPNLQMAKNSMANKMA